MTVNFFPNHSLHPTGPRLFHWFYTHFIFVLAPLLLGLPWCLRGYSVCLQCGRHQFNPWVGKIPSRRKQQPLQYSCLENPIDGAAWWATVHRVAKNGTRLHFRFHFHFPLLLKIPGIIFILRVSIPRQVDKKSRVPKEEKWVWGSQRGGRGLEFSQRRKGQTFFL